MNQVNKIVIDREQYKWVDFGKDISQVPKSAEAVEFLDDVTLFDAQNLQNLHDLFVKFIKVLVVQHSVDAVFHHDGRPFGHDSAASIPIIIFRDAGLHWCSSWMYLLKPRVVIFESPDIEVENVAAAANLDCQIFFGFQPRWEVREAVRYKFYTVIPGLANYVEQIGEKLCFVLTQQVNEHTNGLIAALQPDLIRVSGYSNSSEVLMQLQHSCWLSNKYFIVPASAVEKQIIHEMDQKYCLMASRSLGIMDRRRAVSAVVVRLAKRYARLIEYVRQEIKLNTSTWQ